MLKHLLVIAGPAGAGKSTFIRALSEGYLDAEIASVLPRGAEGWPRMAASDIDLKRPQRMLRRLNGTDLVLHYNTMRVQLRDFDDYTSDPVLEFLIRAAVTVAVVTLVPEPSVLLEQYQSRLALDDESEWWVSTSPLRKLRRALRAAFRKRWGRQRAQLKPGHLQLIELYKQPEALSQWLALWTAYLESLRRRGIADVIFVGPAPGEPGRPKFNLLPSLVAPTG